MLESKAEATDRLRKIGLWAEASKFKDETIVRLRKDGMKRLEAQERGWEAMLEKFPPLPDDSQPEPLADLEGTADGLPDSSPNTFLADTYFVLNSLGKRSVAATDAPTSGAWALLLWARGNQQQFFSTILPKALVLSEKLENAESEIDENLEYVASLEEMLRGCGG